MTRNANTYDEVKAAAAIAAISEGLEAFLCEPLNRHHPETDLRITAAPALLVK
jgi:hypothetical protein